MSDRDTGDIVLLAVAAVAATLLVVTAANVPVGVVGDFTEIVYETAPYNGPIEALLALVTLVTVGIAHLRSRMR